MNDKLEKLPPQMTEQERRADNRRILRVVSEAAMKHLSGDVGARTAATIELLDDYDALARKVAVLVRAADALCSMVEHEWRGVTDRDAGPLRKALADIEGEGE